MESKALKEEEEIVLGRDKSVWATEGLHGSYSPGRQDGVSGSDHKYQTIISPYSIVVQKGWSEKVPGELITFLHQTTSKNNSS